MSIGLDLISNLVFMYALFAFKRETISLRNVIFGFGLSLLVTAIDMFIYGANIVLLPALTLLLIHKPSDRYANQSWLNTIIFVMVSTLLATNGSGLITLSIFGHHFSQSTYLVKIGFVFSNALLATVIVTIFVLPIRSVILKKSTIYSFLTGQGKNLLTFFLLIIFVSFSLSILYFQYLQIKTLAIPYILVAIALAVLILAFIVSLIFFNSIRKVKRDINKKRQDDLVNYLKEIEKSNLELRRFKHDYRNMLLTISILAKKSDTKDIQYVLDEMIDNKLNYLDKSDPEFKPTLGMIENINNEIIKGLLINKVYEAQKCRIQVRLEIPTQLPEISHALSVKIARILGILFDNAVDALRDQNESSLSFAIIKQQKSLEFLIKNPASNLPADRTNKLLESSYSSKGKGRGLGLSTVQKIVESSKNLLISIKHSDYMTIILSVKV